MSQEILTMHGIRYSEKNHLPHRNIIRWKHIRTGETGTRFLTTYSREDALELINGFNKMQDVWHYILEE